MTAEESGTYTDFAQINIGGVTARRLRRRQRGHLPDPGCDRGDAPAAAQFLHPGQQEEPGPLHQAGRPDHPHRLRPAIGLQPRPDRAGAGPPGEIGGGCPQRRHQRLCRDRRFWQGKLQPDRLFQPAQGAGDHPEQRRRSAHRHARLGLQTGDPRQFATFRRPVRRLSKSSCSISSTSRCAATT